MSSKQLGAEFESYKETKGAVHFREVVKSDEEPIIRDLYVRKTALKELRWNEKATLSVVVMCDSKVKKASKKVVKPQDDDDDE